MSISTLLTYAFFQRALVAGVALSVAGSLLGVVLVLKRFSLVSDGLGHVSFAACAISFALGVAPLVVALPVCVLSSVFLMTLARRTKIHADALIALLATSALAVGVIVSARTKGFNADLSALMFGSVLAISGADVAMATGVAVVAVAGVVVFFRRIFSVTFDEAFSRVCKVKVEFYNTVFSILASLVIVVGMKLLGSLMISAVMVFPALSALAVAKSFKQVCVTSATVGVVGYTAGLFLSGALSLPAGSAIVCTQLFIFGICTVCKKVSG